MIRPAVIFILTFLCFSAVYAQQTTSVYYLKNSGQVVSNKDSADLILKISPPDTNIDKNLYIVREYYPDGKLWAIGSSKINTLDLKFEGHLVTFFPNGHKKAVGNYDDGNAVGDAIQYYPNGRFYNKKTYVKTVDEQMEVLFKDCRDSTGKILAENGSGYWITYNTDFTSIQEEGRVANGLRDSIWTIVDPGYKPYKQVYKSGKIVVAESDMPNKVFTAVEIEPTFPGGIAAFYKFIEKNLRYPAQARENNTQGKVIVIFVVEKDGSLTDVKVARGIGDGCDEEVIRVIKSSPLWKPGMQKGKPARVVFSIPIDFSLSKSLRF